MSEQSRKYSHTAGINNEHNYRVRIPFTKPCVGDMSDVRTIITDWNEACAKAIELFGLPEELYTCRFTNSSIEFWFKNEKDALIFELVCG